VATVGAIVAAAGSGSRLGRGSKAYVRLNGRTTLARVLELFLALDEVDRIVVVGPPSRLENAEREVVSLAPSKPVTVRAGGNSRQESVRAGLAALGECDFVLVHDAARPLATATLVRRVLAAAMESGAAFPAIGSWRASTDHASCWRRHHRRSPTSCSRGLTVRRPTRAWSATTTRSS